MEINGTIYKILPTEEVTFSDGTKKTKGGFVIMREGEFPKPVAFELYGEEKISMLNNLSIGSPVRVSFYAESREKKDGNYFTMLRCLKVMQLMSAPIIHSPNGIVPATSTLPNAEQYPSDSRIGAFGQPSTTPSQENTPFSNEEEVPY